MTNYERIKNESLDEMALTIGTIIAKVVTKDENNFNEFVLNRDVYINWLKEWLAFDRGAK